MWGHQVGEGCSRVLHGLGDLGVHSPSQYWQGAAASGHCWPGPRAGQMRCTCGLGVLALPSTPVGPVPPIFCANAGPAHRPQAEPGAQGDL